MPAFFAALFLFFTFSEAYGTGGALPLPRFASLKSAKINSHVGPGTKYPTEWQYLRKNLPVEIIGEYDIWRLVKDHKGDRGWINVNLLSGHRYALILNQTRPLYSDADSKSSVIAYADPGVIGKVLSCKKNFCRLQIEGSRGWIERKFLWGVYPHETSF